LFFKGEHVYTVLIKAPAATVKGVITNIENIGVTAEVGRPKNPIIPDETDLKKNAIEVCSIYTNLCPCRLNGEPLHA
jgi:hypothetical protein